jgi:hypothetical protein
MTNRILGRRDAHRLLPATRIQCLRDLVDDEPRRRADGRPIAQWSRLKAGHSDDLGTSR